MTQCKIPTERKYRLESFGLAKSSLKRILRRGDIANEEFAELCDVLLSQRGNEYTLCEIHYLNDMTYRAHHDCVMDHPDDYSRLEVVRARDQVYFHANRAAKIELYRLNETLATAGHEIGQWTTIRLDPPTFQKGFFGGSRISAALHGSDGLPIWQNKCKKCEVSFRSDMKGVDECTR